MSTSFSVTEVVTAARCPRQLVLSREGHRVTPHGGDAIGQAAHAALAALARSAAQNGTLFLALADPQSHDEVTVAGACYAMAYEQTYRRALELAPSVDGEALARLDGIVRNVAGLMATLLVRARRLGGTPTDAVQAVLVGSEQEVSMEVEGFRVNGRIDLICRDVEQDETWLWDLKTYAGTDAAQDEQVRLYALASEQAGLRTRPALLFVTGERVEIARVQPLDAGSLGQLRERLLDMSAWVSGARPPRATTDLALCHTCPAQETCWSRWGRTLDDAGGPEPVASRVESPLSAGVREPAGPGRLPEPAAARARERWQAPLPSPGRPAFAPPPVPPTARAAPDRPAPLPLPVAPGPQRGPSVPAVEVLSPFADDLEEPTVTLVEVSAPEAPAPLWLGTVDKAKTPARLEPADLCRHVAVFGAAGAGKTTFAKSIVEEALLAGVPALVFDVQGDLVQLAQPAGEVPPELVERRDRYAAGVEVRLLTPGSDAGLRVSLNPVRLPDPSFGEDERAFCLAAVAENLMATVNLPAAWRKGARGYITQHLEAAASEGGLLSLEQLIERLRDPDRVSADPLLAKKSQRETLIEQLRLLTVGPERLLFQRGRPLDIAELVRPTVPGKTPLNILWLNALGDQAAKERFVATVLSDLFAWALRNPSASPQLLFYLDEVGPFMPPRGEPASKAVLKQLFKQGRKLGLCGLFCTQNFTDVDYKVFAQANTLALGRVNAAQDKEKARKILDAASFDATAAVARLGNTPQGRFLVRNPDRLPAPTWVQGRPLLTVHGSPWGEEEIRAHTSAAQRAHWSTPQD